MLVDRFHKIELMTALLAFKFVDRHLRIPPYLNTRCFSKLIAAAAGFVVDI